MQEYVADIRSQEESRNYHQMSAGAAHTSIYPKGSHHRQQPLRRSATAGAFAPAIGLHIYGLDDTDSYLCRSDLPTLSNPSSAVKSPLAPHRRAHCFAGSHAIGLRSWGSPEIRNSASHDVCRVPIRWCHLHSPCVRCPMSRRTCKSALIPALLGFLSMGNVSPSRQRARHPP